MDRGNCGGVGHFLQKYCAFLYFMIYIAFSVDYEKSCVLIVV